MKKLLLTLLTLLAWAGVHAAEVSVTFDFSKTDANGKVYGFIPSTNYIDDNATISEGEVSILIKKNGGNGARFYNSNPVTFRLNNKGSITITAPSTLKKVVLDGSGLNAIKTANGYDGNGTWTAAQGQDITSLTLTNSEKTTGNKPSNITLILNKLTVTYEAPGAPAPDPVDAGLSFGDVTEFTCDINEGFTAPELTKDTTAPVSYSSSNTAVASVDPTTGAITLYGLGTTTITATTEATEGFLAGSASYTLKVTDKNMPYVGLITDCDWTLHDPTGNNIWMWSNGTSLTEAALIGSCIDFGTLNALETTATATSPVIDLTNYWDADLTFRHSTDGGFNGNMAQFAKLYVKPEGGEFEPVAIHDQLPADDGGSKNFVTASVSLSKYAGKKIEARFEISNQGDNAGEWRINRFIVKAKPIVAGTVEAEIPSDAPATYYNLQGQPVAAPSHGYFIMVQANKATKIYVK